MTDPIQVGDGRGNLAVSREALMALARSSLKLASDTNNLGGLDGNATTILGNVVTTLNQIISHDMPAFYDPIVANAEAVILVARARISTSARSSHHFVQGHVETMNVRMRLENLVGELADITGT